MKKRFFGVLAIILSVCFMFAGCGLLQTNQAAEYDQTAILVDGTVITKKDIKNAYDTYFSSYYNSYSDKAFDKMIEDLITERLLLNKANSLIESGEIVLTPTEKNYIYDQTFKAIIKNLESFEEDAKKLLGLTAEEDDEEEKLTDSQYVYTEYSPSAIVEYNEETGKYEVKIKVQYLVAKTDEEGEIEYEYVDEKEYSSYVEPEELLDFSSFVYEKLSSEDATEKTVAQEAYRLYLARLLKNEDGRGLSKDESSVFERELKRIYDIIYKNFVTTKLYLYTVKDIDITEQEILNYYVAKVKETYERYQENPDLFATEVMKSIRDANLYGSYGSKSFSIEDVLYVPDVEETYFMVYHIIVKFSDEQVDRINEAYKAYKDGTSSEKEYNKVLEEEKSKIRLNERDEEGTIIVKSTDDNAKTFDEMMAELQAELAEATTAYEKGDIFNKYLYKYTTDAGSLQIQKDYFGGEHTNWYGYVVGTEDKGSYLDEFVDEARKLYNEGAGQLGDISDKFYMESWTTETVKDENGNAVKDENDKEIKVDKFSYGGFDVMMYAGEISNPFESFDSKDFTVESLGADALKVLSEKRLGLLGNKTLFDLIYEGIYSNVYSNKVAELKKDLNNAANVIKYEKVYTDLNPLA
ncbi:MAG: hypothetical protein MR024_00850 [Firmicutes bacterium]|nr:hypothetical protein [Bacillota bacterium]